MKFKDLKVGQRFRVPGAWAVRAVQEKINPQPGNFGRTTNTHKEVKPRTGICAGFIKDDWDVAPIDDNMP